MSKEKCWEEGCEITPVKKCVDCDNMICAIHARGTRCLNCTQEGDDFYSEETVEARKKLRSFYDQCEVEREELQKMKEENSKILEETERRIEKEKREIEKLEKDKQEFDETFEKQRVEFLKKLIKMD